MARPIITIDALLVEINAEMASLPACRNLSVVNVVHDSARMHGGNWMIGRLVRSGYDQAEFECRKAMADCMTDLHQRFDISFMDTRLVA